MEQIQDIAKELKEIRIELHYIRTHMVDADMLLTSKEEQRLEESLEEHKKGKTKRVI